MNKEEMYIENEIIAKTRFIDILRPYAETVFKEFTIFINYETFNKPIKLIKRYIKIDDETQTYSIGFDFVKNMISKKTTSISVNWNIQEVSKKYTGTEYIIKVFFNFIQEKRDCFIFNVNTSYHDDDKEIYFKKITLQIVNQMKEYFNLLK